MKKRQKNVPTISHSIPWVAFPDMSAWQPVLPLGREFTCKRNETIRYPGDNVNSIYLVHSGMLKISALSPNGLQRTLWLASLGSVIGDTALFSDIPYTSYAVTLERCTLYEFSRELIFNELLPNYPELLQYFFRSMATKSYAASSQLEDSVFLSAPLRLGRLLHGLCVARRTRKLPLTHLMIADLLGLHRVTVSTLLSQLKKEGLLEDSSRGICITDLRKLAAFNRSLATNDA